MRTVSDQIINVFQSYMMPPLRGVDKFDTIGRPVLAERIDGFISRNETIRFAMLGFPFKSTNKVVKVLSDKPDQAEMETLRNFAKFNAEITRIYSPGVEITMASDGLLFNHNLDVDEKVVEEYKEISIDMGVQVGAPMRWLDLLDFYPSSTISTAREKISKHFPITWEQLYPEVLANVNKNILYRGMLQFMGYELEWKYDSGVSRSQKEKQAKALTRTMMVWNEMYSRLTKKELADCIRISMHQSDNSGEKFSFKLIPGDDTHHSAWHSALVIDEKTGEFHTRHKADAEAAGYELITHAGQPFYYINTQK